MLQGCLVARLKVWPANEHDDHDNVTADCPAGHEGEHVHAHGDDARGKSQGEES